MFLNGLAVLMLRAVLLKSLQVFLAIDIALKFDFEISLLGAKFCSLVLNRNYLLMNLGKKPLVLHS